MLQKIFFLMDRLFLHMLTFLCSKLSALSWAFCFLITFLVAEYVTHKKKPQNNNNKTTHPLWAGHQFRIL